MSDFLFSEYYLYGQNTRKAIDIPASTPASSVHQHVIINSVSMYLSKRNILELFVKIQPHRSASVALL